MPLLTIGDNFYVIDLGEVDVSKNNYDKESVIEYSPLCNG
jgi:hypothetical protein